MKRMKFKNKKLAFLLAGLLLISPCTYINIYANAVDNEGDEEVPAVPDSNENSNLVTLIPTSPGDNGGADNGGTDNGVTDPSETSSKDNSNDTSIDDNNQNSDNQNGDEFSPTVNTTYQENSNNINPGLTLSNNGTYSSTDSSQTNNEANNKISLTLLDGRTHQFTIVNDFPDDIVPSFYSKVVSNDENSENYISLQLNLNLPLPQKLLYLKDEAGKADFYVVDLEKKIASKYVEASLYTIGNKKFIISQLLPGFRLPYEYKINKVRTDNKIVEIISIKDLSKKYENVLDSDSLLEIDINEYISKFEKDKLSLNYIYAYPIIDINQESTNTSAENEIDNSPINNQAIKLEDISTLDLENINLGQARLYNINFEQNKIKLDELDEIIYPNDFISEEVIKYNFIDSSLGLNNSTEEDNNENSQELRNKRRLKESMDALAADIELDYLSINNINKVSDIYNEYSAETTNDNISTASNNSSAKLNNLSDNEAKVISINREGTQNNSTITSVVTELETTNSKNNSANEINESQNISSTLDGGTKPEQSETVVANLANISNDKKFNNILYFIDKYITIILLVLISIIVILIAILVSQLIMKKRRETLMAEQDELDKNYSIRRVDQSNLYNPYLDKTSEVKQRFANSDYRNSGIRKSNFKDRARIENGMKTKDDFDIEALADVYYNGYDNDDKN